MKRIYSGLLAIILFAAMLVFTAVPASQVSATTTNTTVQDPAINFYGVYDNTAKTLVLTAKVHNEKNKVSAAMFILEYDSSKLSITEKKIKFLGAGQSQAIESKKYCSESGSSGASPSAELQSGSSITATNRNFVGADWYYSNPGLPASSAETPAVEMTFTVKNNPTVDELRNAIKVTDNEAYLKDKTYDDDGGILICEDGETYFNANDNTAGNSISINTTATTTNTTPSSTASSTTTTTTKAAAQSSATTTTKPSNGNARTGDDTREGLPFAIAAFIVSGFVAITSAVTIRRRFNENKKNSVKYR